MTAPRLQVFSFRGIPVRLDSSWFAIVVLVTWSLAAQMFPASPAGIRSPSRASPCSSSGAWPKWAPSRRTRRPNSR
jgi:hypothetical protein